MPSFDVVSEVDKHELTNAVDQANREVGTRFDFKGTDARFELGEFEITLRADAEFRIKQMMDILRPKLVKRGIDIACLKEGEIETSLNAAKQTVVVQHGIDKEVAKKVTKLVKDTKLKVQAAVQGEQVRVTGKKRDELQQVIQTLREADLGLPLQFTNFRD